MGQRIFDADVHHQYRSLEALRPYMPDGNVDPYYTHGSGLHNVNGGYRLDAVPPGGGVAGSDPAHRTAVLSGNARAVLRL